MVSGVRQMLISKTHKSWENQTQQRRICRQFLLPRPRRLRQRDPWEMELKLQQTGVGEGESTAPYNWAHSAKGAHPYRKACRPRGNKVAAPPLDSPCDGPVTYPGDTKILVKSSKERSGPTLNTNQPKGRRNTGRPRKRWRDQLHLED